jgi:hypothetical protein
MRWHIAYSHQLAILLELLLDTKEDSINIHKVERITLTRTNVRLRKITYHFHYQASFESYSQSSSTHCQEASDNGRVASGLVDGPILHRLVG